MKELFNCRKSMLDDEEELSDEDIIMNCMICGNTNCVINSSIAERIKSKEDPIACANCESVCKDCNKCTNPDCSIHIFRFENRANEMEKYFEEQEKQLKEDSNIGKYIGEDTTNTVLYNLYDCLQNIICIRDLKSDDQFFTEECEELIDSMEDNLLETVNIIAVAKKECEIQ